MAIDKTTLRLIVFTVQKLTRIGADIDEIVDYLDIQLRKEGK